MAMLTATSCVAVTAELAAGVGSFHTFFPVVDPAQAAARSANTTIRI
ncbi:MAG: hypothetical protein V3V29_06075 [Acidimicrobiia bacterium]